MTKRLFIAIKAVIFYPIAFFIALTLTFLSPVYFLSAGMYWVITGKDPNEDFVFDVIDHIFNGFYNIIHKGRWKQMN